MKQYEYLNVNINDGIYWLTLNRPDARNALDAKMFYEIEVSVKQKRMRV
ncbi:hypothetical protein [Jeotgalibacillus marinus]|uniref:Enoyl-CoA hydratase n=1 Tax=Jeotgalibacillus marinus TaxID=86667 RepID=A0ABV3Q333_9BACL